MPDELNRSRETNGKDSENVADSLFNYPTLERLFTESDRTNALAAMRAQLGSTMRQLDRVVRQGTPADARRATAITRAYDATLTLLGKIEKHRDGVR